MNDESHKFEWSHRYTLVLVMNAIYIVLFYLLMQNFG